MNNHRMKTATRHAGVWTKSLLTGGLAGLAMAAQAEEAQNPVPTTLSSTVLSGYVDTSAILNFGSGNRTVGRSFDGDAKQDGFNFNAVKLQLERPLTDGDWSAGYRVGLVFGPDANVVGSTSTGLANANSDVAVKNAHVTLRAPVGSGLEWKMGVWDTPMGYEVFEAGNNAHYSRSFGFYLEPMIHTGVLATYRFSDVLSVSAGVSDPGDIMVSANTINARGGDNSTFTYLGSFTLTAPEGAGFMKGATLTGCVIDHGVTGGPDVVQYYVGATMPTPIETVSLGLAYDYRGNSKSGAVDSRYANAVSGYLLWRVTEKLKLAGRVEYATGTDGTWYAARPGADNELLGITGTLDYSLWANVISRFEVRWDRDLSGTGVFNDGTDENSVSLALNVIYNF